MSSGEFKEATRPFPLLARVSQTVVSFSGALEFSRSNLQVMISVTYQLFHAQKDLKLLGSTRTALGGELVCCNFPHRISRIIRTLEKTGEKRVETIWKEKSRSLEAIEMEKWGGETGAGGNWRAIKGKRRSDFPV